MTGIESTVESAFVAYAESIGCKALKLRIDGQNGWPDRTVVTPRGTLFAEFKTEAGKLRPMQRVWKKVLEDLGYIYIIPRQIGDAEKELDRFLA